MNHLAYLISPELKLAALLSRPTLSGAEIGQACVLLQSIDHSHFKALLDQHRIWPSVYLNIKDHFAAFVPADLLQYLAIKYRRNVSKNYQHLICYGELLHHFESAAIPMQILKGIPLAKKLYGDIAKRYAKDIDLIIPADRLSHAHELIMGLGYTCEIFDRLSEYQQVIYLKSLKDIAYTGKTGVRLELHVRPCQYATVLSQHYARQLFDKTGLEDTSHDELIYLCWHGTQTFYHRLKWLLDIVLYIEQLQARNQLKVDSLTALAGQLNAMRPLTVSWVLANLLYATPLPEPIADFYHRDKVTRRLIRKSLTLLAMSQTQSWRFRFDAYFYARLIPQGWADKRLILKGVFTPNIDDINLLSALPVKLAALHSVLQPFVFLYTRLRPGNVNVDRG